MFMTKFCNISQYRNQLYCEDILPNVKDLFFNIYLLRKSSPGVCQYLTFVNSRHILQGFLRMAPKFKTSWSNFESLTLLYIWHNVCHFYFLLVYLGLISTIPAKKNGLGDIKRVKCEIKAAKFEETVGVAVTQTDTENIKNVDKCELLFIEF